MPELFITGGEFDFVDRGVFAVPEFLTTGEDGEFDLIFDKNVPFSRGISPRDSTAESLEEVGGVGGVWLALMRILICVLRVWLL